MNKGFEILEESTANLASSILKIKIATSVSQNFTPGEEKSFLTQFPVEVLVSATKDTEKDTIVLGIRGLAFLNDSKIALSTLLSLSLSKNIFICNEAIKALVNFNNLEALKAIIASTQHENDSISKTSLALLKSLDPKLVIPTLIHMQTKNEIEFRKDRPKFNQLVDTFSPDEIKSYLI